VDGTAPPRCIRCGKHPAAYMLRTREQTGFCSDCYVAALQVGIHLGPAPV
jgi:hypothetical protein